MNIFFEKATHVIPRILGLGDRDESSSTYGCFDRTFWHYKTIDFPNARFQESSLTLALLSSIQDNNKRFAHSQQIRSWSRAATTYWTKVRHLDGSVDESYPNEHHFCATALSFLAITEAAIICETSFDHIWHTTARFLTDNSNCAVSNQTAGAAVALYNAFQLSGDDAFRKASFAKIEQLLTLQHTDGYFPEYGGFDAGYNSITLSFLALLYKKTIRSDIQEASIRCAQCVDRVLDSDGYFDPDPMSRNNPCLYPFGFAVFLPSVINKLVSGLQRDIIVNPLWLDDRYCIPLTNDYLMAAVQLAEQT